ncbi:UNVERIFIED_CONTAM: Filament-like plant protein 3 [Sesamum radiatum]|uniref:Filament-like plant protein 3 n=1 Tax=Sesamum radiatum TaxID=300843 RepID=A0AAW2QDJ3_SESRA
MCAFTLLEKGSDGSSFGDESSLVAPRLDLLNWDFLDFSSQFVFCVAGNCSSHLRMEKRKWLWKRKSSERSPGESDSSDHFLRILRDILMNSSQSPEVTSKTTVTDDEVRESVKTLTEKLSAALVNVSAKEDLVKQHAKVAEEAVAGWEKAENEVAALKQQLEVSVQQNLNLEVKTTNLDGALKECVRQLRQARDEQEKRISDAVAEKNIEWQSTKAELEQQILDLKAEAEASRTENAASTDPNTLLILEAFL